jgi:hypothetical protein
MAQTVGGFVLARAAHRAAAHGHPASAAKRATAAFYCTQLLPPASALLPAVTAGSAQLANSLLGE